MILPFILDTTKGAFMRSRPYNRFANTSTDTIQSGKKLYHVTLDCGNITYIEQTFWRSQNVIRQLAGYGYPWFLSDSIPGITRLQQTKPCLWESPWILSSMCVMFKIAVKHAWRRTASAITVSLQLFIPVYTLQRLISNLFAFINPALRDRPRVV